MTEKAGDAILWMSGGHPDGTKTKGRADRKENEPGAERPTPERA